MRIVITTPKGKMVVQTDLHCAIDKMVAAIKQNAPDWIRIEIEIVA